MGALRRLGQVRLESAATARQSHPAAPPPHEQGDSYSAWGLLLPPPPRPSLFRVTPISLPCTAGTLGSLLLWRAGAGAVPPTHEDN